jgi:hypothetical protein
LNRHYTAAVQPRPVTPAEFDDERLAAAMRMTIEQRLLMGPDLFDLAVESIAAGLRAEGHEPTPEELRAFVRERFGQVSGHDDSD